MSLSAPFLVVAPAAVPTVPLPIRGRAADGTDVDTVPRCRLQHGAFDIADFNGKCCVATLLPMKFFRYIPHAGYRARLFAIICNFM